MRIKHLWGLRVRCLARTPNMLSLRPFFLLLLLVTLPLAARADHEAAVARQLGFRLVRLAHRGETVSFLVAGDSSALQQRKPVLLFCQGSETSPLITVDEKGPFFIGWSFDFKAYQSRYHVVVIGKPGVPVVAPVAALDPASYSYLDPATRAMPAFLQACDTREYYADTAEAVLRYLRRQSWTDPRQTVVMGGSQGYHVAARLARLDRHVTHAVLFSSNPYSRLHQYVSDARAEQYRGHLTPEQAQGRIDTLYTQYRALMAGTQAAAEPAFGAHWRNWVSFTKHAAVDELLQLRIPVLVAYGTADVGSALNDLLPFEFMRCGKTNLTLRPYPGLTHQFLQPLPDKNGQPQRPEYKGNDVLRDVMQWLPTLL